MTMTEHSLIAKTDDHEEQAVVTITDIKGDRLADRLLKQIEQVHGLEVVQ